MPDFILEEGGRVKRLSVPGTDITIGRDEGNDLVVDDENASRNHARLQRLPEGWVVQDLDSANGTMVDGSRCVRVVLGRGSVISVGACTLTFLGGGEEDNPLAGAPSIEGLTVARYAGEGPLTVDYAFRRDSDGKEFTVRHIRDVWADDANYMSSLVIAADELRAASVQGLVPFEFKRDSADAPYLLETPLSGCPRREDGRALRMAESEALRMALGVAKILSRMHEHDIRHHGLHPGRVGLTEDGEVQLGALAFPQGVATRTPDASVRSLSCLAPEGFSPKGVLGRRSDIYAVGALLHELLLGAPIAEGNTIEGCTRSVLRGIQRSPDERRPGLSPGVSDLIMDCTQLDPQERIENIEEVVSRLTASLLLSRSRSASSADVDPLIRGENERPQRSKSSTNISYVISAAIFIILQGVVYWLFYRE